MSRNTAPAHAGGMPTDRDSVLVRAFQDLEHVLVDLRGAAAVLEIVEEKTILRRSPMADLVQKQAGLLPSYEVFIFTPGEAEALRYATLQLRKQAGRLAEAYYAAEDKANGCGDR